MHFSKNILRKWLIFKNQAGLNQLDKYLDKEHFRRLLEDKLRKEMNIPNATHCALVHETIWVLQNKGLYKMTNAQLDTLWKNLKPMVKNRKAISKSIGDLYRQIPQEYLALCYLDKVYNLLKNYLLKEE